MKIRIHHKIVIIISIISALILLSSYIYLNSSLTKFTYDRLQESLSKELSLAKSFLETNAIANYRSYELDNIADSIGKDLKLRATIIGMDGVVYGDTGLSGKSLIEVENHLYRPEVQDAIRFGRGESTRFSHTVKKNMLYMASLFGKSKPEGIIRLSVPLSDIKIISDKLKRLLSFTLLLAFFASVIISFLAFIFISNPVKEASWVAHSIARGDYSKRVPVITNDEIGELSKAINYMAEQIRSKIEEITASKSRLEAVLLSMFEGVMVVDADSTIHLINKPLTDTLFITDEAEGKKPLEVIRNVDVQNIVDEVLAMKEGMLSKEISLFLPREKTILIHAVPIIKEQNIDGAILVFHDISELRRLENIRKDFVANVSHELRTPISNIRGYTETLLDGAIDDKENAKDFLKIIYADAERLSNLVDDLLDLSRIESGNLILDLKPLSIKSIIEHLVTGFKKQAEEKEISIKLDIPDDIVKVRADEKRLSQVFFNLIDNAIKYNKEKGDIAISAAEKNGFVEINISDTGIGIPEEDLPRIFERFFRVDKSRSRELGGTGLGLSIVKHIVHAHDGEVSVKSAIGEGSVFSFTIPLA